MAMYRYGHASLVSTGLTADTWTDKVYKEACSDGKCRIKTAKSIIAKYDPSKYVLSHCTIVASVDTELADPKDPKSDYFIRPEFSKLVNNNGDAWTKKMLLSCYRTFIGGDNFQEHVQIPELSKGKIIDAAPREIVIGKDKEGNDLSTVYIDILVATDRKHEDLVRKIEAKELTTLSMGCHLAGTEITLSDGTKRAIEDIRPGDMVLSHKGIPRPVMNIQRIWHQGQIMGIKVEGDYKVSHVTPEHPYWGFNRERECACGCGEKIRVKLTGHKNNFNGKDFEFSQYKRGHYARVINPNTKTYSIEEYLKRKNENSIKGKLDLSWIKAGELKPGDLVSYPISTYIQESLDATVEKARLIGYFLAEGSFVKEMVACGEENDYGVRCRICGNLYNKITTHLSVHKMNKDQYLAQYPDAPLNARVKKQLIRVSRKKSIEEETGLTRSHKKVGAEFSLGKHEFDTLNAEIASLAKTVFPTATVLRYDECVKVIGPEVADFFSKFCGEYFDNKVMPEEVLYWPLAIQKHIIATWVLGDFAVTGSKKLNDQMHFLFSRNKVHHNLVYREASPYKTVIKKVVNGETIDQVYGGIRSESYALQLNTLSFDALKIELDFAFKCSFAKYVDDPYSKVKNSWKNVQDLGWHTRKITEIKELPFEGWVYNFEVDKDDSYIANDVAVHNCTIAFSICSCCGKRAVDETEACNHVRFQKNNMFFDKNGVQRKIAELCGHHTEPDSVKFIEASWVKQPAFTGAVLRDFVQPSEEIMAKITKAEKTPSYVPKMSDFLKVAELKDIVAQPKEDNSPADEPPAEEPAGPPADEPPADTPEEPAVPEEQAPPEGMPEDQVKKWKEDLKKQVLRQVTDEVLKQLSEDESGVTEPDTLDETLIKPASLVLSKYWGAQKSWDRFIQQKVGSINKRSYDKLRYGVHIAMTNSDLTALKTFGYNQRDFLAVLSFLDGCLKNPLPMEAKRAIASMGDQKPVTVLKGIVAKIGRKLTTEEARKILAWMKLLEYYPKA